MESRLAPSEETCSERQCRDSVSRYLETFDLSEWWDELRDIRPRWGIKSTRLGVSDSVWPSACSVMVKNCPDEMPCFRISVKIGLHNASTSIWDETDLAELNSLRHGTKIGCKPMYAIVSVVIDRAKAAPALLKPKFKKTDKKRQKYKSSANFE
ncbi:unnamed protein product [Echinostoma caproni]|uniref:START domain-containing protein n=1 Tax=Echinostoma caproni TaxID=27848 RepID=A0A183B2F8_9TREM|nr:unnamed protein product [Echinostoma caproni]